MDKKIVIGSDHGGYRLKEQVKKYLEKGKYKIDDVGTDSESSCDYPVPGFDAARKVSRKKASRGIVICKTGIGMSIIANKLPGVRAGLCNSIADAASSRQHNDANVLVLAATKLSSKKAIDIVKIWMKTKSLKGRHSKRVRQITKLEKKVFKKNI